jgi:hypothetical protein
MITSAGNGPFAAALWDPCWPRSPGQQDRPSVTKQYAATPTIISIPSRIPLSLERRQEAFPERSAKGHGLAWLTRVTERLDARVAPMVSKVRLHYPR